MIVHLSSLLFPPLCSHPDPRWTSLSHSRTWAIISCTLPGVKTSNATVQSDSALLWPLSHCCLPVPRGVFVLHWKPVWFRTNQKEGGLRFFVIHITLRSDCERQKKASAAWIISREGEGKFCASWCLEKADIYCTNVLLKAPSNTS